MFDSMFHTTATGETILIASMEDSHLLNAIGLFCRKMEHARAAADAPSTATEFERELYGFDSVSAKDAAAIVRQGMALLQPYVLEAALRGLDVRADLQAAIGRTGQLGAVTRLSVGGKVLVLP